MKIRITILAEEENGKRIIERNLRIDDSEMSVPENYLNEFIEDSFEYVKKAEEEKRLEEANQLSITSIIQNERL